MNYCCITQRFNSYWHHPHKKFMLASKSDEIICQMAYNSKVEALSDLSQGGNVSQLPPVRLNGNLRRVFALRCPGVNRNLCAQNYTWVSLVTVDLFHLGLCYDLMEVLFKASQRVLMLGHRVFSQLSITNTFAHIHTGSCFQSVHTHS